MIEFKGYLTGAAERWFWRKSKNIGLKIIVAAEILLLPTVVLVAQIFSNWVVIAAYCILSVIFPLLMAIIPKSAKEKKAQTPKRIYIEDEQIICITGQGEEIRNIHDVKCVYEHEEFYDLEFPFGKISDKFVCQKALLSEGSLEEFSLIFKEKILKKP